MGEKIESAVSDVVDTGVNVTKARLKPKTYIDAMKGTGKAVMKGDIKGAVKNEFWTSPGGQDIKEFGNTARKRSAAEKAAAQLEAANRTAEFEAQTTQKETEAKRKAAEERIARRQGTPGRPIFTPIGNRNSLL
jgi:membrane protein involved in colicin uptake